ncbi:MAG: adenylate kinase [Bacteroidota bacterium]|nr:adenylate kinase [Bacteroidota bacterium]
MLNIALFGPPGAGKGTQSKLLIEKYNLVYISTGDILRAEIEEGTSIGQKAKNVIEKGGLVDDEIIVRIIEKIIVGNTNAGGFLFDGFPRTFVQAYILEGLLFKLNTSLTCMLSLEVPTDVLKKRLLDRAKIENRKDDTEEVINVRLREYETKTARVAGFYKDKGLFHSIDGLGKVEDIYQKLVASIETSLKKVWMNIVLFGPPGAGKGTQGQLLAKKHNLVYISTGAMLRRELANGTKIGREAAPFMEKGAIVPDEIAIRLIEQTMNQNYDASGFIFKGFPRTYVQAYILDGLLQKMNSSVSVMININVSTLELLKRLTSRGKTESARKYDLSTEIIIDRLEEFENKTSPVADYYLKQNKCATVDGLGNTEEVFDRLSKQIESVFKHVR